MAVPKHLNLVGPTIREMRMKRGWTQEYLAKKVSLLGWKMTRDTVAQLEATQKRIGDCDLLFLAKALDANIIDFFPLNVTAETLKGKIRSWRLIGNKSVDSPPEISTASQNERGGIFRRFAFWNSRRV